MVMNENNISWFANNSIQPLQNVDLTRITTFYVNGMAFG